VPAGVAALRQAWEAAEKGIALGDYATAHPALAKALEAAA
jgi:ribulose 1,5-bisphosphate carboxylase large subunit-like protein